ncbi:MAG: hypothetical protein IVW51_16790 [Thermaceae bacterium]|nr:hypothetical protein [Thermaceae bacterium]
MAKSDKTDNSALEPQPEAAPETTITTVAGTVRAKLGPNAPAGRLLVGNAVLSASDADSISLEEFEALKTEYDLIQE